jgi:hypothetical protein
MSMHSEMSLIPNADSRRPCTSATTQATVLRTAAGPSASLELTHDSLPRDRSLFRRSPSSLLPLLDCPPPMDISVHSRPRSTKQDRAIQDRKTGRRGNATPASARRGCLRTHRGIWHRQRTEAAHSFLPKSDLAPGKRLERPRYSPKATACCASEAMRPA